MIKVNTADHTENELTIMAMAINRFGCGQHPWAEAKGMGWFAADYALECLEKAMAVLNAAGQEIAETAMLALRDRLADAGVEV